MSVVSNAYVATVSFKGSDIMAFAVDNPTSDPKIGDGYISLNTGTIRTYGASADSASFNNWIGSLGSGEGVKYFNLWLQDGASNQAALWGETIALKDAYSDAITVNAPTGWIGYVYTIQDEWGPAWTGRKLICYEAVGSDYYLRSENDFKFSFTADIIGNNGATGPTYQMWIGTDGIAGHSGEGMFQRAILAEASVPGPAAALPFLGGLLMALKRRRK